MSPCCAKPFRAILPGQAVVRFPLRLGATPPATGMTFCISRRRSRIMASSLSSGEKRVAKSPWPCFGCSSARASPASETTSTSPDRQVRLTFRKPCSLGIWPPRMPRICNARFSSNWRRTAQFPVWRIHPPSERLMSPHPRMLSRCALFESCPIQEDRMPYFGLSCSLYLTIASSAGSILWR